MSNTKSLQSPLLCSSLTHVPRCVESDYFVSKKGDESCTGATTVEGSSVNGGNLGPTTGTTSACYKQDDPWRM